MAATVTIPLSEYQRLQKLEAEVLQHRNDIQRLWNRLGQLPQNQNGLRGLDPSQTIP